MPTDVELLRRYAEEKSEASFGELVQRQMNLVYSVALRQCGGDTQLAEDVAQRVFTDLARKARPLSSYTVLGGWLYRSAQFAASDVVRGERRRRAREQEAQAMHEITQHTAGDDDWQRVAPLLDEAVGELPAQDRDAVVLRFVEGRRFADIGSALRLSEDAARMRVERALEKLRAALVRRGISSTTAALGLVLAKQASAIAPPGVTASVTGLALSGAAAGSSAGVLATLLTMSKIKVGSIITLTAIVAATGIVELRANRALRAELGSLRAGEEESARLARDNRQLNASLQKMSGENPEAAELARLHARVAQLQARPEGVVDSAMQPVANRGRATAEDAFVTFAAALNTGDLDGVAALITFRDDTPESRAAFMANFSEAVQATYRTPERLFAAALFGVQNGRALPDPAVSYQVVGTREGRESGESRVGLWIRQSGGRESEIKDEFQRTANGWGLVFRALSDPKAAIDILARIDPVTGEPKPAKDSP